MPTVYGAGLSPFVRKVRVALAEKGLPYDLEVVMPGSPDPEFRKMSPLGKIPAFRDGERTLSDSSVICQYLERTHPEPPLYPSDPYQFARALWFEEYADTALVEVVGGKIFFPRIVAKLLMGKEPDEAAVQKAIDEDLPPRFDYLESQLGQGPYLVGERFTVADAAVTSMFANLQHAGVVVDAARWPKLAKYVATHLARPSFAALIQEEKAFLGRS
jgi:glutathione S-transferase